MSFLVHLNPRLNALVVCFLGIVFTQPAQLVSSRAQVVRLDAQGTLRGQVVEASQTNNGQPVSRAMVRLLSGNPGEPKSVLTAPDGTFTFDDVSEGRYAVEAQKPAYVKMAYGASKFGQPGTPVVVRQGERIEGIRIALPRGGVLAGTVLSPSGTPVTNVSVTALRATLSDDGRPVFAQLAIRPEAGAVTSERTDSRGAFRLYGLPPGRYILRAASQILSGQPDSYTSGFYPSGASADEAQALTVDAGSEVTGLMLRMLSQRLAPITGTIVNPSGAPPRQFRVQLDPDPSGAGSPVFAPNGAFGLRGITGRTYQLSVRGEGDVVDRDGQQQRLWGETTVFVDERGADNIVLALQPGVTIPGRIVVRGSSPIDLSLLTLRLRSLRPWQPQPPIAAVVQQDGFTFHGVAPGRYAVDVDIAALGPQAAAFRASVILADGEDVVDSVLAIRPDGLRDPLLVTMTDARQGIRGRLLTSAGLPAVATSVVLLPSDRRLWLTQSRRIRVTRPGTDGQFAFDDIPSGSYRMAAVLDPDPDDLRNLQYVDALVEWSIEVNIQTGEQKQIELRSTR